MWLVHKDKKNIPRITLKVVNKHNKSRSRYIRYNLADWLKQSVLKTGRIKSIIHNFSKLISKLIGIKKEKDQTWGFLRPNETTEENTES